MARNTEYEFVSTDASTLVESMTAVYESLTDTKVLDGSPENLFLRWVANVLLIERAQINRAGNANIPSRAEDGDLEALGETIFNLSRPAARASTTTMRFYISEAQEFNILIPAGTRVTDQSQSLFWDTDSAAYVMAGSTYVDVPCTCETAGTSGNGYVAGQINAIVDVFEYYLKCENLTDSAGGSAAATDDEYYELMKQSMNSWSTAGAKGGYIYYAKSVSTEIADVVAKQPEPGYVYIYALKNDGTLAEDEIKKAILAACNADYVRPLTDHVSVHDGEEVDYNIDFTYYTPTNTSKSATQMAADVQAAVDDYVVWQQSKFGRDINPDKLREFLLAAGVKRITLREPAFTVLNGGTGEDYNAPQIGKVGTITITDGGYEDE